MSVKGAIFDLDGTIVDSMSMWHDVTVCLLEEQGVNNPEEGFRETEPEPLIPDKDDTDKEDTQDKLRQDELREDANDSTNEPKKKDEE